MTLAVQAFLRDRSLADLLEYALHAALTRLLGALPDDETVALEKAGAR